MRKFTRITTNLDDQSYQQALLELLPECGCWSEGLYLRVTDHARRFVEYTDGYLEFLPWPTLRHHILLQEMLDRLASALEPPGEVIFGPYRVKIRDGKFREPDLVGYLDRKDQRMEDRFAHGADIIVEIVHEDDPDRDLVTKPKDYAEGKIPEYWIVNPLDNTITVLTLGKRRYKKHGVFRRGQKATSVLLPDLIVDVDSVLNAG